MSARFLTQIIFGFCIVSSSHASVLTTPIPSSGLSAETRQENERFFSRFASEGLDQIKARQAAIDATLVRPSVIATEISRGFLSINSGSLVLKTRDGNTINLISAEDQQWKPLGKITEFRPSPSGERVLVAFNEGGKDESSWLVVTTEASPQVLTATPLRVRHSSVRWGLKSDGVYSVSWARIEDVPDAGKSMLKVQWRAIDLATKDWSAARVVFDLGELANTLIYDVDGGDRLIAYNESSLGTSTGVKIPMAAYLGTRQLDGTYQWQQLIKRNQYSAQFLGVVEQGSAKRALFLSNQFSDRYSIASVALPEKSSDVVLTSRSEYVPPVQEILYNARVIGDQLFLVLQNKQTLTQRVRIVDVRTMKLLRSFDMKDLGFKSSQGLITLPEGGSKDQAYFVFQSVIDGGNFTIEYSFLKQQARVLESKKPSFFGSRQVKAKLIQYPFENSRVPALVYYLADEKGQTVPPKFIFQRIYGQLGISTHTQAEVNEIYGMLDLGGIMILPSVPGHSDLGARWHDRGVRDPIGSLFPASANALEYVRTQDQTFAPFQLPVERTVLMGRSWGGMLVLAYAAYFPQTVGAIVSIVPVPDVVYGHQNLPTQRVIIMDHHPDLDRDGQFLIDQDFWDRLQKVNPMTLVKQKAFNSSSPMILTFSAAKDDQIGQPLNQTILNRKLKEEMGEQKAYSATDDESHGSRFYRSWLAAFLMKLSN